MATGKVLDYGNIDVAATMLEKGRVTERRITRRASENAACNPYSKRIEDCAYVAGHGYISIT